MAAQEKIKCKVTDTKLDILKAYKAHLDDINARSQGSLDPNAIAAEKTKTVVLDKVAAIGKIDVPTTIATLQTAVSSALSSILVVMDEKNAALADIQAAILLKQADLKELYGIEQEAASLAALIEAHKNLEIELSEEETERRKAIDLDLEAARKSFENSRTAWQAELAALKAADTLARKRELEEYTYKFGRDKAQAMDILNDEVAKRLLVATSREEAVALREANVETLEKKVVDLEVEIVTEAERVRKETEESCKRSAATVTQFATMSHENKMSTLTAQLEAAVTRATDLLAQNTKLQNSLDLANDKIQNIALEALKSGADAKTIAEMRGFDNGNNSSKK